MQNQIYSEDDLTLKELITKFKELIQFLFSKWVIILATSFLGALFGLRYAWFKQPVYKAVITFALEDEKQGGLTGALGLASSLGFDLGGSAGGAFSGANLIELMKSRKMVEIALLNPIRVGDDSITLADRLIEVLDLREKLEKKKIWVGNSFIPLRSERASFNLKQDSLLGILYQSIIAENGILSVAQKDKKVSIITVEVKTTDEFFSKELAQCIVNEVSKFYIETKSKKARNNVAILQKQTDSVRNELNQAITGVAVVSDNTFNLNPALNVNRVPSTKKQVDIQANTAILTQLVTNLELAKVALMKETPLIQVIDRPILPLKKEKIGKLRSLLLGGFLGGFLSALYVLARRFINKLMG